MLDSEGERLFAKYYDNRVRRVVLFSITIIPFILIISRREIRLSSLQMNKFFTKKPRL